MSAPDYVPVNPLQSVRSYTSPPRREDAWHADRPGEIKSAQPVGERLGSMGPDQGYAYKLVGLFEDRLVTGAVNYEDAVEGCIAVAMKRAALFGRAPVVHDLTVAFSVYGFTDKSVSSDLVRLREKLFAEVRSSHHYAERRHLVDIISQDFLTKPHAEAISLCSEKWSAPFLSDVLPTLL